MIDKLITIINSNPKNINHAGQKKNRGLTGGDIAHKAPDEGWHGPAKPPGQRRTGKRRASIFGAARTRLLITT